MTLFIAGFSACIVLLAACGVSYYYGTKMQHKSIIEAPDEEKQREIAKRQQNMDKLLNYDVGVAFKARGGAR